MKRFGLFVLPALNVAIHLHSLVRIIQDARLFRLPLFPHGISAVIVDEQELVPVLGYGSYDTQGAAQPFSACRDVVIVASEYGRVALSVAPTMQIVAENKCNIRLFPDAAGSVVEGELAYHEKTFAILNIDCLMTELVTA